MSTRTATQLATLIKQMIKMDLAELGADSATQSTYIYDFMTRAMWELVALAFNVKVSDALAISTDDYVTFQISAADITDLYEPLRILDSDGNEVRQRTSFTAPTGWYKESANAQIHVKGLSGDYTLHYKAYPAEITTGDQVPEWPASAYLVLVYHTMGMIRESKNYFEEANDAYNKAKERMTTLLLANQDARGYGSAGRAPTLDMVNQYMRG